MYDPRPTKLLHIANVADLPPTLAPSSSQEGGGIATVGAALLSCTSCIFRGNTGYSYGGAVQHSGVSAEFQGCRFEGNRADYGAAIDLRVRSQTQSHESQTQSHESHTQSHETQTYRICVIHGNPIYNTTIWNTTIKNATIWNHPPPFPSHPPRQRSCRVRLKATLSTKAAPTCL